MTDQTLPRRDFYVYKLLRLDGSPFYVGRGTGTRIKMHEYKAKRGASYKDNIICQIMAMGLEVPKIIVAHNLTDEEANALEIKLIAEIGRHPNGPLTNRTRGGEGIIEMPPESLERKRAKLRARIASPETREKIRLAASNPSPETRAKMSAAHKGRKENPLSTAKRSAAMKGIKRSEETKAKLREAAKRRDPEVYERIAAKRRGSRVSEETKKLLSASTKDQWARDRGLILEAMKKRPLPSAETKAIWSAQRKGKKKPPMSETTKGKIREARARQAPMSVEARAKISAALRARPTQSEETRQKRRDSVLRAIARKKDQRQ